MRMRLRPVQADDHPWLVELHNDLDVLHNMTDPRPVTMESHLAWWRSTQADPRQQRFVFDIDGARVGFAKVYNIDQANSNCLLGGDIHRDHRGNGYAARMWGLLLTHVFTDIGLHRVSLTTAEYNDVAMRVYVRLGFKPEGRLVQSLRRNDQFHDQICMYLLRHEWVQPEGND